jgi:hypothetical protein
MSLVTVAPEFVGQAAGQLESIGSALTEAAAAAAAPTTGVLAPAADEVSAAITALFGSHAQQFQALSAQAEMFHNQFVGLLNAGAGAYVSTELANAAAVTGGAAATSPINEIINGAEAWLNRPLWQAQRLSYALYRSINGSYQFPLPGAAAASTNSPLNEIINGAEAWLNRPLYEAQRLAYALYRSINGSYQFPLP